MRGFWVRAWSEDRDVHTAEDMTAVAAGAGMDQRTIGECLEAARSQVVLQKVASELHPKVRNHGEGPYQGLLLVESGYYRFHI